MSSDHPPPPSPGVSFKFTCACLNVAIEARVQADLGKLVSGEQVDGDKEEGVCDVWIDNDEVCKLPTYVSYDVDEVRQSRRPSTNAIEEEGESSSTESCWRKCWICDVRLYQVSGRSRSDPGVKDQWVKVDLTSGILHGSSLEASFKTTTQPLSSLLLPLPSTTSTFGRPPPSTTPHPTTSHFLPPLPDPFFLPPPFIPSNPHLRDLCTQAITKLRDHHLELERDVRAYAEQKGREMKAMEDVVRGEVEYLWDKYKNGPGKGELAERRRSRSMSGSGELRRVVSHERGFSQTEYTATDDPSPSASGTIPSTSLLSASISARTFHAPPRPAPDVLTEDPVALLTRTASKTGDKDIAASYMLSTLEAAKGSSTKPRRRSVSREGGRRVSSTVPETEEGEQVEAELEIEGEAHERDSWIGMERQEARKAMAAGRSGMEVVNEEGEGRTPRPREVKELKTDKKDKDRQRSVKFEEPSAVQDEDDIVGEEDGADGDATIQEDYVFDFEIDDVEHPAKPSVPPPKPSRSRNMVEANLSHTFAADAPSHRAAWRKIEASESMYTALKRESSYTRVDDHLSDDEEGSSSSHTQSGGRGGFARSMPVNIVLPTRRRTVDNLPEKERKTSLSDRSGILVPPLKPAMRISSTQSSKPTTGNSLGLEVSPSSQTSFGGRRPSNPATIPAIDNVISLSTRRGSRSASASRERESIRGFGYEADPGGIFESLIDGDDIDDDEEEGDEVVVGDEAEDVGGGRGRRFIPPHVLAGRSDGDVEVGWRSLAS